MHVYTVNRMFLLDDDSSFNGRAVFSSGTLELEISRSNEGWLGVRLLDDQNSGYFSLALIGEAMETFNGKVLEKIDRGFRDEFIFIVVQLRRLAQVEEKPTKQNLVDKVREPSRDDNVEHATTGLGDALLDAGVTPVEDKQEEVAPTTDAPTGPHRQVRHLRMQRSNGKKGRKAAMMKSPKARTPKGEEMLRADRHLLDVN